MTEYDLSEWAADCAQASIAAGRNRRASVINIIIDVGSEVVSTERFLSVLKKSQQMLGPIAVSRPPQRGWWNRLRMAASRAMAPA